MRKYLYIGIGGSVGAILRYMIKNVHINNYKGQIPLNTLMINLSGSFILALILTTAFEVYKLDTNLRLGIATGFLGAYTTFSTLCKETVTLINKGYNFSAIAYIGLSVSLGLFFVYLGTITARVLIPKLFKHIIAKNSDKVLLTELAAADRSGEDEE